MPTKGFFSIAGLDQYLEKLEAAGRDVDQSAQVALGEAAPIITEEMHRLLKESSEKWTGGADATIFQDPPAQDGNYNYVRIGVHASKDPAGFYKEFGTARQAAEPFFRPAMRNMRSLWRNEVKEVLTRLGKA